MSEHQTQFCAVPVRLHSTADASAAPLVEFVRADLAVDDTEQFIDKVMADSSVYAEHFVVYMQTLISQALDANFLNEIMLEKDDYFLSNVQIIDAITDERRRRLLSSTDWSERMVRSIETWPDIQQQQQMIEGPATCAVCRRACVAVRLMLYGVAYDATTLRPNARGEMLSEDKVRGRFAGHTKWLGIIIEQLAFQDFLLCRICASRVELYHKISHQKHMMFGRCVKRVAEKRAMYPPKMSTDILNELLADDCWIAEVRFENAFGIY